MNNTLNTVNTPDKNSNSKLDFEKNFNDVVNLCNQKYTHNDLISLLSAETIEQKQLAVLELSEVISKEEALKLTTNLVGQDGKIREAVAFKINEFMQKKELKGFFLDDKIFDLLLLGIMDINGNVCRQIVELSQIDEFKKYLSIKLPSEIFAILDKIKMLSADEKQYKISKRNFQLYWSLEALYNIADLIDFEQLKTILIKTSEFEDYTIREKAAKILTKFDNLELDELKNKLKIDENYYVRRYLS